MKITALLLLLFMTQVRATTYAQRITLYKVRAPLQSVLEEIRKQSGYDVIFDANAVKNSKPITVNLKESTIENALDVCLKNEPLTYKIEDRFITIIPKRTVYLPKLTTKSKEFTQIDIEVSGRVFDQNKIGIPGVTVKVLNTEITAITKENGGFSIKVPDQNALLVFSSVGYQSQNVSVGNKREINVTLVELNSDLNEVVVVAYGTQKKETLTGSVSSIKGSDLLTTKTPNVIQSLQGKLAGVQIRQSSSIPGGGQTSINIRGFGTPLIVIDGVLRDGTSEFERLDPNDIESITVLKDGAAAIYGIGASNGVLLVTTKKGTVGPVKVSYVNNVGFSSPTNIPKAVNAANWVDLRNELTANIWQGPTNSKEETQKYKEGILPGYESIDWYSETMKSSSTQNQQNLSLRGGGDVASYFVSFGYTKDNGLVRENPLNYEQLNFRANSDIKLAKSLNMNLNLSGRRDLNNQISGGFITILSGVYSAVPFQKPYINDDPNFPASLSAGTNPVALTRPDLTGFSTTRANLIRSSASLTYDVPMIKGLQAKLFGAYDINQSANKNLSRQIKLYKLDPATQEVSLATTYSNDLISLNYPNSQRVNLQAQLSYKTTLADNHNISAMLLYEQRKISSTSLYGKRDYDFYTVDVINQGSLINQVADGSESEEAYRSYVGRLNYDFKQKYLLELVFREDGSYRYNPDQRWGFFPGLSLAWRASEESFVKNNLKFISNLKFRASYGETGEDAGSPFQYLEGYQTGSTLGYEFVDGVYKSVILSPQLVNRNLTWYKAKTYDVGFDLDLFKNGLIGFTFDVYRRDRSGLLSTRAGSLPNTFGASLPQENLNSDRVEGFDFSISHRNKIGEFNYAVALNMNISQSKNLYIERSPYQSSYAKWRNDGSYRNKNIVWGYEVIGRFKSWDEIRNYPVYMDGTAGNSSQLPGDPIYKDVNNDGLITTEDMQPIYRGGQILNANSNSPNYASGQPPVQYGINLSGAWKGIDFNVLIQGAARYTVALGNEWQTPLFSGRNAPEYLMDRWHLADPYNKDSEWIPGYFPASRNPLDAPSIRLTNNIYRRNASYVRLKNVEIGYTLPKTLLSKVKIDNFRIYMNATNLYTRTDKILKLFDPERGEGDFGSNYAYPLVKSVNLGVNVTF